MKRSTSIEKCKLKIVILCFRIFEVELFRRKYCGLNKLILQR